MNEVLFNKLQRLKEEFKYLADNKLKFSRTIRSSVETEKIVERSVYLCSEAVEATVQVTVLNNDLTPVFGFEIVKEGIVLLDRDENLRIDFESRILRQYYDWQYFLKRQMEAEKHLSTI